MRILTFVVALLGLAVGMSCSQSLSNNGDQGPDGAGGTVATGGFRDGDGGSPSGGGGGIGGGGGCQAPHYYSAGCDAKPRCPNGFGGACAGYACSCGGKVIVGCATEFAEPYAYTLPFSADGGFSSVDGPVGSTCDPNAASP